MRTLPLLISALLLLIFSGCAPRPEPTKKGEVFAELYNEQPRSLLILPPMNESTDAEAKGHYMTTLEVPPALQGYYVFPIELVSQVMAQEGVYDTELLYKTPPQKFAEYFGADMVLFTRIKNWDVAYVVLASTLTIRIDATIVSTRTGETLWHHIETLRVDLGGGNSGNGLAGLLADAIATAINTAAADYVEYARTVSARMFVSLPKGPYHERYLIDRDDAVVNP